MTAAWGAVSVLSAMGGQAAPPAGETAGLQSVRFWSGSQSTRVAVEVSREVRVKSGRLTGPERLFFDFLDARPDVKPKRLRRIAVDDGLLRQIRVALKDPRTTRVVLDLSIPADYEVSHLTNPPRVVIEVRPRRGQHREDLDSKAGKMNAPGGGRVDAAVRHEEPDRTAKGDPRQQVSRSAPAPDKTATPVAARPAQPAEPRPGKPPDARPKQIAGAGAGASEEKPLAAAAASGRELPAAGPDAARPKAAGAKPGPEASPAGEELKPRSPVGEAAEGTRPARPTSQGTRSLTRALGLRIGRVVLDPGHGGHDHGTTGPSGLTEKELVLDIAQRLGRLIEMELGGEVVYTRQSDEFIPLEERTAIANEHQADLFLSIHANSSPIRGISGAEVFYLNFTTSRDALDVAARENAGHGKSIFELRELIQKIALKDKLDESREFANSVQKALSAEWSKMNRSSRNRGVKKAPFVVLIGASMPSVLAEIGFINNPRDEALLAKPEGRQRIAGALYQGVKKYAASLGQARAAPGSGTAQSSR